MLKIENLNVAYGDVQVIWDLNMTVEDSKLIALVGSNAAGKSTTINTICGLIKPKSGVIDFDGHDLTKMNAWDIPSLGVIQVPEGRKLFAHMDIVENLELGSMTKEAKPYRKETMQQVFDMFPVLFEKKQLKAGELSGGQQQMLAIGRALMTKPKILMMDELSLGLAPVLVEQIFESLDEIRKTGVTILIVEQNVQMALEICDYAYVLENGRIAMEGDGKVMLQDENLKKAYLGM